MEADDIEIRVDTDLADDPIYTMRIVTPEGSLDVMGAFEVAARRIVVRGLHIGGDPEHEWGWSGLRRLGRLLLEKLDVDDLIIHGAVRTTGANPGRRPGIVRLSRSPSARGGGRRQSS